MRYTLQVGDHLFGPKAPPGSNAESIEEAQRQWRQQRSEALGDWERWGPLLQFPWSPAEVASFNRDRREEVDDFVSQAVREQMQERAAREAEAKEEKDRCAALLSKCLRPRFSFGQ